MTNMPKKLENSAMSLNTRALSSMYNNTSFAVHGFIKDKNAWENAISMYQGPDPLDHWYNYICWYENHRHADPENQFRPSLERCLSIFEHNEYYKQDVRMVRLWVKYIDMQPNPLHFYQVLHTRGVGRQVAAFYISWAGYYESVNALKEAEAVYNVAFKEKAQSYAELHHAHSKFLYAHSAAPATPTAPLQSNVFKPAHQQQEHHTQPQHYQHTNHQQTTTQLHHQQQQQQRHDMGMNNSYGQTAVHRQQIQEQHNEHPPQHPNSAHLQMSPQIQGYRQQSVYPQQNHHIHHQQPQPQQQQQQQQSLQHIAVQQQTVYQQPVEVSNYNHPVELANHHVPHQQHPQPAQQRINDIGHQTVYLQQPLTQSHPQLAGVPPVEQQLPASNVHAASNTQSQTQQIYTPQATLQHQQQYQQHQHKNQLQPQPRPEQESSVPVQEKVGIQVPGIKLPKKFASYSRNNYETWKPALFLEEPADPCRQCHYQKQLVYPEGEDTEYSPEELRAKSYLERFQTSEAPAHHERLENWNISKIEGYSHHAEQTEERVFQQISTYNTVEQHRYVENNVVYSVKGQNGVTNTVEAIDDARDREEEEQEEYEGDEDEENDDEDCEDDDDDDREEDETEQVQHRSTVVSTVDDVEDQIEASTIRFSMHSEQQGVQNKTIKIKFKKEPTNYGDAHNKSINGNYSAYKVVQNIYQQHDQPHHFNHVKSTTANHVSSPEVRRNGHSHGFHPYMIEQTSTPKASSAAAHQRHYHRGKLKKISKFPNPVGSSSNSSSADNVSGMANGHGYTTHNYHAASTVNIDNSLQNATFNDNANYSFSSAVALENSNCSLTSAVDRLNFRDSGVGGTSKLNSTNIADFSTYQENSFFATQHDTEAKERRLQKAIATITAHLEKAAIDPFSNELCRAFLTKLDFPNVNDGHAGANNLRIIQTPLPKLANTRVLSVAEASNLQYNIDKEVGRGSYGSVYKASDVNTGAVVALKYQKPPNTWEIYICDQVLRRIKSPNILPGLMDISAAIIAPNASLIATEFSPFGSLLDINNKIRQNTTKVMHESLVMHFSSQICNIIHHLHKEKIIHADIKPDNFLLMRVPSTDLHYPSLRLIDFGCAIDMTLFPDPEKTKFRKVIQTDGFTCIEMQEGRPWSYETDIFCIAGTVHVMLLGEYMQLQKRAGSWDIKQKLPRYLKKHVWNRFFGEILNIKDGRLPDLYEFHSIFEDEARKMDSELQKQIRTLSNILYRR